MCHKVVVKQRHITLVATTLSMIQGVHERAGRSIFLSISQGSNERIVIRELRSTFHFSRRSFSPLARKSAYQNMI